MAQSGKIFIKKLLSSKVFLFLISLILIALVTSLGRESYRKYLLVKEINQLKADIEQMEGKSQQLANLMEYFKEESYLEKEARLKLNLKKPGEEVVIVSEHSNTDPEVSLTSEQGSEEQKDIGTSSVEVNKETTNYWKWWEYFFQSFPE